MTIEDISNQIDSLHTQYKEFSQDWEEVFNNMDNDTQLKFSLQTLGVPPVSKEEIGTIITGVAEKLGKGQEYGYISRMKRCAGLLVEAKRLYILQMNKEEEAYRREFAKANKSNWPFQPLFIYTANIQEMKEAVIERMTKGVSLWDNSTDWKQHDEAVDSLLKAPTDLQGAWSASLTSWWDSLKRFGVVSDNGGQAMLTHDAGVAILKVVNALTTIISDEADKPNHCKNVIIYTIQQYDHQYAGIIFQILILTGLKCWVEGIPTGKEKSGHREVESLTEYINKTLTAKLKQWVATPYDIADMKVLQPLGNYAASTPQGQAVIRDNTKQTPTKQTPTEQEERRKKYIEAAISMGWVERKEDAYIWKYDMQPRTGKGNVVALAAFLTLIYGNGNVAWKEEEVFWKVNNLKQSYQSYLNGHKKFKDIKSLFE